MPFVSFDDTITDSGSAALSGSRVLYVAWEILVEGPGVRQPSAWDTTMRLGVGHWEIGNDVTALGLISGVCYDSPHWIDTTLGQWIAIPGEVGGSFGEAIADHIRWSLTEGTSVHLYVFGDT